MNTIEEYLKWEKQAEARTDFRPQAEGTRINTNDDFELCYIRHKYFRKVDYNPTEAEMEPYTKIITSIARHNIFSYKSLFSLMGFEVDDLINIGRIHLVSFLGLFSLERNVKFMKAFISAHQKRYKKEPQKEDFLDKNKANFTLFLKQRMGDIIRICRQKARNIRGINSDEFYVYVGEENPPNPVNLLLLEPERFGFKKINTKEFKIARREAKTADNQFLLNGKWYVLVNLNNQKTLSIVDFNGAGLDPYESIHNMTPEQILFHKEEEREFEDKKLSFYKESGPVKAKMLKKFIDKNFNNPDYRQEVKLAKKFLRDIGE